MNLWTSTNQPESDTCRGVSPHALKGEPYLFLPPSLRLALAPLAVVIVNYFCLLDKKKKKKNINPMDLKVDFDGELVGSPVEVGGGKASDENDLGPSSVEREGEFTQVLEEKFEQDPSDRNGVLVALPIAVPCVAPTDEPYAGQEFDSEGAAHAFYNAYATRVGFVIRVSKLSRSRRDGSAIGRAFVCNKEGYRMPDKREKILRQRAETRVGCRAMLVVRKVNTGKWVVSKFVREHSHPLSPGKGRRECIYDQYPDSHDKIRELSQQLATEKKRASAYKRHLDLLFEHIESHNESLAKKIQHIVDNVRELESREIPGHL